MKPRGQTARSGWWAGLAALLALGPGAVAAAPAPAGADRPGAVAAETAAPRNLFCPVLTDRRVDPAFHATYQGREVFFCCAMCRRKFLADPAAYLANLPQFGGVEPSAAAVLPAAGGPAPGGLLARLGWFHPLAVHFPIALLLAAALAELLAVFGGWEPAARAVPYLLIVAVPAAVLAMLLGFATAAGARYAPEAAGTFLLHRGAGIAAAALAALAAATLRWRERHGTARRAVWLGLLLLAALAVGVAGHFGAVLVHGHGPLAFSPGGSS